MTRTRLSLIFGGAVWMLVMTVYAIGLTRRGNGNLAIGLLYNAPIALLFLVLAAEIAICFISQGARRTLAERGPMLVLWLVGLLLLFLRLGPTEPHVHGADTEC